MLISRTEWWALGRFEFGDRVKYRLGRAPDRMQWHAVGEIIEVEAYPILMGPVPRVRARIAGVESAWTMPSEFEFGIDTDEGFQRRVTAGPRAR